MPAPSAPPKGLAAPSPPCPTMSRPLPQRIATWRLLLRQPTEADIPAIVRGLGNPAVARRLGGVPLPYRPLHARRWLRRQQLHRAAGRDLSFVITLRNRPARVVGGIAAHHIDQAHPVLGYWLAREAWGRRLASEAVAAVLAALLRLCPDARPQAAAQVENRASHRVLAKSGFRRLPGCIMLPCVAAGMKVKCLRFAYAAKTLHKSRGSKET